MPICFYFNEMTSKLTLKGLGAMFNDTGNYINQVKVGLNIFICLS